MQPRDPNYKPPAGATLNESGYWILPSGDFAPGQDMSGQMAGATDAQRAAAIGPAQTDASGKSYVMVDGQKHYLSPGDAPASAGSASFLHSRPEWDPLEGAWNQPVNWGNVLSAGAGAVIAAPVVAGAVGAGGAGSAAASSSAAPAAAESAAAGAAAPLASTTIGSGAVAPIAGGAGLSAPAAAASVAGEGTMGLDSVWDAAGNFTGDSTVNDAAGGVIPWQTILKYGLPTISGAANSALSEKNIAAQQQLQRDALNQQKQLVQTGQALDQSKLDPFRGVMAQTSDLGKLEHAATPPPAYGPAAGSPYASAVPKRAPLSLSPLYSSALRNAQGAIAQGKGTVPNMLDSSNWGDPGTMDLTTTAAPPAGAPSLSSLLARYKPLNDDGTDPNRMAMVA